MKIPWNKQPRFGYRWFILFFAAMLSAAPARASLILMVQSTSAFSPSTGNLVDVDLINSGPGAVTIGGFFLEVTTADAFVTFTGATVSTASPYIFAGNSGDVASSFPFVTSSAGQTLDASDFYATFGSGTLVASGATVGLAELSFDLAAGDANPTATFSLTPYPSNSLSDQNGSTVNIDTFTSGTVTITRNTAPEPSSVLLLLAALPVVALRKHFIRLTLRRSSQRP
jgi:hypothetical protein